MQAIRKTGGGAEIGFKDGTTGRINSAPRSLKAGDIIAVSPAGGNNFRLRNVPKVSGGMVVQNPRNGRIWAMQGGFDDRMSPFNRATQATRQPGSSFKPLVYAAALDSGYSPATIVIDAPIEIDNGDGSIWRPKNASNQFYGPTTLRTGIERSRNLMPYERTSLTMPA